jgi:photosystem II stability/assembly factor-like uncharacterized protein
VSQRLPDRRATRTRLLPVGLAVLAAATALFAIPPGALAQEWAVLAQPTTRDLAKLAFLDPWHGWAVGDSGTIVVTTDAGGSWTTQVSPVADDLVDVCMLDANRGWAVGQRFPAPPDWDYGSTLIRTTDGGANWIVQTTFDDLFVHAVDFTDAQWGVLGGDQGNLWWTNDGGVTWTPSVVDSADAARWPVYEVEFHTATYGMATGGLYDVTGLVWKTTDRGQSWTHQRVAGEPFFGIHFFDASNVLCVGGDLDFGAGKVRTTNGGDDWEYTYLGIWGRAAAVSFRTATEGWAPLGFASTIMRSRDGGDQWDEMPTPGDLAMQDVVFLDSGTGYMAGEQGTLLRYVGEGSAVAAPGTPAPTPGLALRARPNPFGPATRIEFRVPARASVSLRLYDVAGREVARLVDESLPGGMHSRSLDGTGLPDGVYFLRLEADGRTSTRKLLHVR